MEKTATAYELLNTLMEILEENNKKKNCDFKEKIYIFNELDLFLSNGVDVQALIEMVVYRKKGLPKVSKFPNFDLILANKIVKAYDFLQELSFYLRDTEIKTKYEYYIDGKMIVPTEEQQKFVKDYLKATNVPVNELTYMLAMRRLIVGGNIESKFDRDYVIDRTIKTREEAKKNNENNVGI